MSNLWLDMPYEMRVRILDNSVLYGHLSREFVEDIKHALQGKEEEKGEKVNARKKHSPKKGHGNR